MIYIPSYKRASRCKTAKLLSKATICVHSFEVEEYKKWNNNKIMEIPDILQGKNMAVIRNFILDNSKEEKIVMCDDDISSLGFYEKEKRYIFNEEEIYEKIEIGFNMAEEIGTKLWGVNMLSEGLAYRTFAPFSLTKMVLGVFMGIVKDENIRFDERLGLKEDYDYSIQVLRKYRKILRFDKYNYVCTHLTDKGGCSDYRTMKKEKEQLNLFQKKWGDKIVKKQKTSQGNFSPNPKITVPIKGT